MNKESMMRVRLMLTLMAVCLHPVGAGAYTGKTDCPEYTAKQECYTDAQTHNWSAPAAMKKLGRGLSNIVGSPLEIPETINEQEGASEDAVANFATGTIMGLGNTVVRLGVGVYEVVTFFAPERRQILPTLRFFNVDRNRF